jgi:hypothetical protein
MLEILLSKLITAGLTCKHKYGSKFIMELENGTTLHISNVGSSSLLTFRNVVVSRFEERSEVPRVGDIWIPKAYASPDCFIKFFILGVENLLQGDKILKVEVGGGTSQLIS